MATSEAETPFRLRMSEHHCRFFHATFEIPEDEFRVDEFRSALPPKIAKAFVEHGELATTCNRRTDSIDFRIDLRVHRTESPKDTPTIFIHADFHPTKAYADADERPPHAEGVFEWIHSFIVKPKNCMLREEADFLFAAKEFGSQLGLPYTLFGPSNPSGNPILEQASVYSVQLIPSANAQGIDAIGQWVSEKDIIVRIRRQASCPAKKAVTIASDVPALLTHALATVRKKS